MRNVDDAHDEIFWKITAFRNGGYMLSNVANGTNWHLHAENTNTVSMTNNITGEQDNQKFSFSPSRPIDDVAISSVKLWHISCWINSRSNISSYLLERIQRWPSHHSTILRVG
jgi:hypothetical protein